MNETTQSEIPRPDFVKDENKSETVELIKDPCTWVVPPKIHAMMTGVKIAKIFPSGVCQLEYLDGNFQSAHLTVEQLALGRENFFSLVSAVQNAGGPSTF